MKILIFRFFKHEICIILGKRASRLPKPGATRHFAFYKKSPISKHNRDISGFLNNFFLVSQRIALNQANNLYKEQNQSSWLIWPPEGFAATSPGCGRRERGIDSPQTCRTTSYSSSSSSSPSILGPRVLVPPECGQRRS